MITINNQKIRKILLVVPKYSSFTDLLQDALQDLKIQSEIFDNRKTKWIEKIYLILSKIFPFFKKVINRSINRRLIIFSKKYSPDLILVMKGENIFRETIRQFKKETILVNWFPDYLEDFKNSKEWLEEYPYIFMGCKYEVAKYKKKGYTNIYYLPFAGPKKKYSNSKRSHKVVFIGAYNPNREKIFSVLKDLPFEIWGNQKWVESSLVSNYRGEWLSASEVLDIFDKSQIIVNFHQNKSRRNTLLNLRMYEATASGALLITDHVKDMEKSFKPGEIVIYKNRGDLLRQVTYYLEHENEGRGIARAGYIKSQSNHTYDRRLQSMFEQIDYASE